jgi:hypothetical protein
MPVPLTQLLHCSPQSLTGLSARCREAEAPAVTETEGRSEPLRPPMVSARLPGGRYYGARRQNRRIEDHPPEHPPGLYENRPHTLRQRARTDDASLLSVRGANAMAGARPTPSRARRAVAPDEGRCRADPHCTIDGTGRPCRCTSFTFRVFEQYPSRFGAGPP